MCPSCRGWHQKSSLPGPQENSRWSVVLPGELGCIKIVEQVLYWSQDQKILISLQQQILFGCQWPSLYPIILHSSYLFLALQFSFQREHLYALTNSAIGEKIGFESNLLLLIPFIDIMNQKGQLEVMKCLFIHSLWNHWSEKGPAVELVRGRI